MGRVGGQGAGNGLRHVFRRLSPERFRPGRWRRGALGLSRTWRFGPAFRMELVAPRGQTGSLSGCGPAHLGRVCGCGSFAHRERGDAGGGDVPGWAGSRAWKAPRRPSGWAARWAVLAGVHLDHGQTRRSARPHRAPAGRAIKLSNPPIRVAYLASGFY